MNNADVIVGIPDGHLHEDIWTAMIKSGLSPQKSPRGYIATTNIPELLLKIGRPADIVDETYDGSCVGGYTGEEILENKMLRRPELKEKIEIIKKYPIKPTKLVAAISNEVYPDVSSIEAFINATDGERIICATEYENIARDYLGKQGIKAIVRKVEGKTESKLLPPNPAADIIIETVERGTTLRENNCKIIDIIRDYVQSLFIVNKDLYAEPATKRVVDNFTTDIEEALDARNKILFTFNVPDETNIKLIEDYLMEQGYRRPTISSLRGGGVAIQVLVRDMTVANGMMPFLREKGAEDRITQVINTYGK